MRRARAAWLRLYTSLARNVARSCSLKSFFTCVGGFSDNSVPGFVRSQLHSEHPQAAKFLSSSQTSSLAMAEHSPTGPCRLPLLLFSRGMSLIAQLLSPRQANVVTVPLI